MMIANIKTKFPENNRFLSRVWDIFSYAVVCFFAGVPRCG